MTTKSPSNTNRDRIVYLLFKYYIKQLSRQEEQELDEFTDIVPGLQEIKDRLDNPNLVRQDLENAYYSDPLIQLPRFMARLRKEGRVRFWRKLLFRR